MYSIQKATAILGISERTINRWMDRYGLKKVMLHTDRRRCYISDNAMDTLADHVYQKVTKNNAKTKNNNKTQKNKRKHKEMLTIGEVKYYSLASAASLLGVAVSTVKRWSRQDNVEKKLIMTDKKRCYISREDVLRIAELHRRKVSPNLYEDTDVQRDVTTIEHDMDELCSVKEVALYLDISHITVRRWIRQANIEVKTKFIDNRDIASITYRDVVMLADLHRHTIAPNTSSLTVKEEIKEMKGKIEKLAADIEDIKHDFRLFAKRSIYIG